MPGASTSGPHINAVGGIPDRSTVFQTISPSGADDTAAIQAALDRSPPNQVVEPAAGVFRISGEGLRMTRSEVTLRGSGPARTLLVKEPGTDPALTTPLHIGPGSGDPGTAVPVWLLGYTGTDPGRPLDPTVAGTVLRHGNYDYPTGRTDRHAELPDALPDPLYLSSKPAFFGDAPWPWVTPEDPAGAVATLPARTRFDATSGD